MTVAKLAWLGNARRLNYSAGSCPYHLERVIPAAERARSGKHMSNLPYNLDVSLDPVKDHAPTDEHARLRTLLRRIETDPLDMEAIGYAGSSI